MPRQSKLNLRPQPRPPRRAGTAKRESVPHVNQLDEEIIDGDTYVVVYRHATEPDVRRDVIAEAGCVGRAAGHKNLRTQGYRIATIRRKAVQPQVISGNL